MWSFITGKTLVWYMKKWSLVALGRWSAIGVQIEKENHPYIPKVVGNGRWSATSVVVHHSFYCILNTMQKNGSL